MALHVSTDVLGVKPLGEIRAWLAARVLKRLEPVADRPPDDQCTILKLVEPLTATRTRPR